MINNNYSFHEVIELISVPAILIKKPELQRYEIPALDLFKIV